MSLLIEMKKNKQPWWKDFFFSKNDERTIAKKKSREKVFGFSQQWLGHQPQPTAEDLTLPGNASRNNVLRNTLCRGKMQYADGFHVSAKWVG